MLKCSCQTITAVSIIYCDCVRLILVSLFCNIYIDGIKVSVGG